MTYTHYRGEKAEFRAGMQRQGARSHKSAEDIIAQFLQSYFANIGFPHLQEPANLHPSQDTETKAHVKLQVVQL